MDFKIGDTVTWASQANGGWKEKTGTIVGIDKQFRRGKTPNFVVEVPQGGNRKPKRYTPRTSALKLVKSHV